MPLTVRVSETNNTVVIHVTGRFDFNLHRDFRYAYEDASKRLVKPSFIIDLGGTEYMDSSALGMLLLLREHTGGDKGVVNIINARPEVKKILEIASFGRLFKLA